MSVFFFAILLNQCFLFRVVADMTGVTNNKGLIPTWLMAILKFIILVITLLLAVHNFENRIHIVVGIYIFQLIILVISTKRIVKKN